MAAWDESKHKRGQPNNAGQFVRKDGTKNTLHNKEQKEKTIDSIRRYSYDPTRDIAEYGGLEDSVVQQEVRQAKEHVPRATSFADKERKNTIHHQRHAREMGYKNQDEYERAGCDFFNGDQGKMYYGIKRKRYYRYDERTHELAVSSDGVLHTYMPMSNKEFSKKIKQEHLHE